MRHRRAQELAMQGWDAPLTAAQQTAVDRHLRECPACAAHVQRLSAVRRAAILLPGPVPPRSLDARIDRLAAQVASSSGGQRRSPLLLGYGLVAATAAFAVLAVVVLGPDSSPAPRPTPLASTPPSPVAKGPVEPMSRFAELLGRKVSLGSGAPPRLDLGYAELWFEDEAAWTLRLADSYEALLELDTGRLRAEIAPHTYLDGLRIACLGAELALLEGSLALWAEGGRLVLEVWGGEVLWLNAPEEAASLLGPGTYEWLAGEPGQMSFAPVSAPQVDPAPLDERAVAGEVFGSLPAALVRAALAPHKDALRSCYEQALKRDPGLVVLTEAELSIGVQGEVAAVRLRGLEDAPGLRQCFSTTFREIRFPAPRGGPVRLQLPLRLYPAP